MKRAALFSLLGLLFGGLLTVGGGQEASAADGLFTSVPQSGTTHVLRRDNKNGNNTVLRLAIYTDEGDDYPSTNPVINMNIGGTNNCKSKPSNTISISNGSPSAISAACPQNTNITLVGGWSYDSNIGRYVKDVQLTLNGSALSVVNFRLTLLTGGFYIGYHANGSKEGYAVVDENGEPTYIIQFAANPCGGNHAGQVGVWDAREDVRINLRNRNRDDSNGWNLLHTEKNNSDDEKTLSHDFTVKVSQKYQFEIDMSSDDDTVSMWWPDDSVYAASKACYRYDLTPIASPITPSSAIPGQTIKINTRVTNNAQVTSKFTNWEIRRVSDNKLIRDGRRQFGYGSTNLPAGSDTAPSAPLGTQVCYYLRINPHRILSNGQPDNTWQNSNQVCFKIAKQPKVHIMGGDLRVLGTGDSIQTSITAYN